MNKELLELILFLLFLGFLIPIVWKDIKSYHIPDLLVFPCMGIILTLRLIFDFSWFIFLDLAGAFLFIWLLWFTTKGKIGLGDAKLSGLIGVTIGLPKWFMAMFTASLAGLIYGLLKMLTKKMKKHDRIPFAPFLAIGSIGAYFMGDLILRIYYGN